MIHLTIGHGSITNNLDILWLLVVPYTIRVHCAQATVPNSFEILPFSCMMMIKITSSCLMVTPQTKLTWWQIFLEKDTLLQMFKVSAINWLWDSSLTESTQEMDSKPKLWFKMDQETKQLMPVQWQIHVMSTRDIVSMMVNVLASSDAEKRIVQQNQRMTLTLTVVMIIAVSGWTYLLGHWFLQIIQTTTKT